MSEKIQKVIYESREREKRANTPPYRHSDIVGAQNAAYTHERRFREALSVAIAQRNEALTMVLDSKYANAFRQKWDASIEGILAETREE